MWAKALLLGLSAGPFCLGYCLPVLFPLACAGGEGAPRVRLRLIGEFSAGRLVAYLGFGAAAGVAGGSLDRAALTPLSGWGLIALSLLLMAYGLVTGFPKLGLCSPLARFLPVRWLPAGLGFLTGLNVCPPFLMAVGYVFSRAHAASGVAFFAIYFAATTLWLLPAALLGAAARIERVRWIAQLAALAAGALFLWTGLGMLAT